MTEEIINADGSRNWEANILLDNIKRLEQDSKQLTQWLDEARRNANFWCDKCTNLEQENKELYENGQIEITKLCNEKTKYRSALEEIKEDIRSFYSCEDSSNDYKLANIIDKINEVLGC